MSNKFATKYKNKFDELRNKLKSKREEEEKRATGATFDDSWKFKPTLPANKPKVSYRLRILPNVHSEAIEPWVKANFHMFRRADGKFIYTVCPSTFEDDPAKVKCPICEKAKAYFATGDSLDEKKGREIYKKPRYFVNVLVKKDPRAGEESQEGKVLVWEFGNQIFEKLVDALIEEGVNFHHPTEGVDFNLVLKKKGEFTNYESSHFASDESAISDDESEMNEIYDSIYNLEDKILGKGAKEYDKLLEMLTGKSSNENEGKSRRNSSTRDSVDDGEEDDDDETEIEESDNDDDLEEDDSDSETKKDDDDDFDFDFDDDDDED